MLLSQYPRPAKDNGWGFHDSAGADSRPGNLADYARYLRQDLGITWFKALVMATNKVDLARTFSQAGIEVIVRLYSQAPHPNHVVSASDVRAYVQAGVHYFEWGNEPNLVLEWNRASWNEGARVDKVCQQFLRNADAIRQGGGIPLFPALSPGGDYPHRDWYRTTFEWFRIHGHLSDLDGAALAVHNRPFNRPLTHSASNGCCFLDYEWLDDLVNSYMGRSLPLLGTESGYEPGWNQDATFPAIDLQRHSAYNIEILRNFGPYGSRRWRDCLFCQCMWLVDSFGHSDFSEAAWHNNKKWAGGGNLPAVAALRTEWQTRPFARQFGWESACPYYHSDRHGYALQYIVIHDTEGSAEAALAWWASPSNPYKSSAHDLVRSDGRIEHCVPYDKAAHHCGGSTIPGVPTGSIDGTSIVNLVSIGIELEYPAAPASPPWPQAQIDAAVKLVADIARRYSIPHERILRHADVDPKNRSDPRNLDWAMFLARVMAEVEKVDEQAIRNAAWQALGIPYNPDAAFPRYAREHGLGNPVTREVDVGEYRLQGFSGGIVYARIGDWANCAHIDW